METVALWSVFLGSMALLTIVRPGQVVGDGSFDATFRIVAVLGLIVSSFKLIF